MRRSYDKQFKIAAVKLVQEDDMSVADAAKALSIHYNSLYRWISEYEEYGESAFPGHGTALYSCQYEIKKLRQENNELKKELKLLKKLPSLLEAKEQVRFQYLKENHDKYNIKKACKALNVSRAGYYKYLNHKPSKRDIQNEVLSKEIKQIFEENKGRYGSIRIAKALEQKGIHVNRKRVSRLMRNMKLFPKGCRYRYKHYNQKVNAVERPNLLNQIFQSDGRNKIWVGDITYIPTKKGNLYLAVFIDIYSRKVVGWSMDNRMKETLVMGAFMQAYGKEHPKNDLIVHTDQGSQFTGGRFQALLKKYGAVHSQSRKGNPYDNAVMESFYRTIKRELIQDAHYESPEQAQKEIFKYIELYYNTKRMHSSLGYLSPSQFEELNS
ncbi:IS3 family transposase [Clostridium sp. OS1-26]|uniref:IS3 family transposase n=1 Tax=Clostridium sp. OS1-26 TaxID=3070681 RepID=UPI0027E0129C|nr:IS3 family transposase [Clostridium sp. OS1-26]WML34397.1 IS3 family transposase [Clostridium sp. OS1-26]WML37598.1 IS3 family transposase [Clostridium sp. OS1-26]